MLVHIHKVRYPTNHYSYYIIELSDKARLDRDYWGNPRLYYINKVLGQATWIKAPNTVRGNMYVVTLKWVKKYGRYFFSKHEAEKYLLKHDSVAFAQYMLDMIEQG